MTYPTPPNGACVFGSGVFSVDDLQEQKKDPYSDFFQRLGWFTQNPFRTTFYQRQVLIENPHLPLSRLVLGDLFWKTLGIFDRDDLKCYRSAVSNLLQTVIVEYCPEYKGILEIGAGNFPIIDDLFNISEEMRNQIHISDFVPLIVERQKEKRPYSEVFELDARSLSSKIPAETYECIIMRDVLSVFTKADCDKSLQEAAYILKPGGYIMHFQLRETFPSATYDQYSTPNTVIFPTLTLEGEQELLIVSETEFKNEISKLSDDDPVKKALMGYEKLFSAEREEFCGMMLPHPKGKKTLKYLAQCLLKLKCPSLKKVNLNKACVDRISEGLKKAGFEILRNEQIGVSAIVDRKKAHDAYTVHSIDRGVRSVNKGGALAAGMVQETAEAHVIVARKI